tara:strand:+ start:133 stop:1182 length:1050 start_codon:yes stop_codon:yes gene_type:complete
MQVKPEKVIIIGCGNHARTNLIPALLSDGLFSEILIYDLSIHSFDILRTSLSKKDIKIINFCDDWEKLENELNPNILAIVSTTADSHMYYLEKLINKDVQFIYIEKPLAQSLEDIDSIHSLFENKNVKVASGAYTSMIEPVINFSNYQKDYKLGSLCGIHAYGGNNDLSAFGVHITDLANILFDSTPDNVISNIIGTSTNPRGRQFLYLGGTIFFQYPRKKELTISYHPNSFVSNRIQLILRYGMIEFEYQDQNILKIFSVKDKSKDRPLYKHQPIELVDEIILTYNWKQYFKSIFNNLINGNNYPDLKRNLNATIPIIGALVCNDMKKLLQFPIDKNNPFYKKKYPIT